MSDLQTKDGWFIQLTNSGEKSLSSAAVINKVAFFTTFAPGAGGGSDPCHVGEGTGRIYALQYLTGNAVFDYDLTNDTTDTIVIKKEDRSKNIGMGIPSGVIITFIKGAGTGYIGIGGGISTRSVPAQETESTFWKIIR